MSKFNDLINGEKPVLIDFFAEWCGPCKTMAPILKEVKETLKESVSIIKIDVDKNPNVAQQYQVRGVPTLALMQKGKLLWRQSGVIPTVELINTIKSNINNGK